MRVAIPDLISNSYFPIIAAVELGLFRSEGLDMDLELIFPVTRAMEALRDGACDFVAGTASATLTAFPRWGGAKLLAALAQRMYWFLVLRSDIGAQRGDLSALRGLRIGAAPGVDLGLLALLDAAGIDPERDRVRIGPVPGSEQPSVSFGVTAAQALADGKIDGFWANGMGAEVAVRRGIGTVILDVRRGDGPPQAANFTFPALVATDQRLTEAPESIDAAVRALVRAQAALRADPERATDIGRRLFPPQEAALIAELVRRDLPYYNAGISAADVERLNRFAIGRGLLDAPVPYDQVVASRCAPLWNAPRS